MDSFYLKELITFLPSLVPGYMIRRRRPEASSATSFLVVTLD